MVNVAGVLGAQEERRKLALSTAEVRKVIKGIRFIGSLSLIDENWRIRDWRLEIAAVNDEEQP